MLRNLDLVGIDIYSGRSGDTTTDEPFGFWLNKMIDERSKLGCGPSTLTIEGCRAHKMKDIVKNWKKRVETVVWDGRT